MDGFVLALQARVPWPRQRSREKCNHNPCANFTPNWETAKPEQRCSGKHRHASTTSVCMKRHTQKEEGAAKQADEVSTQLFFVQSSDQAARPLAGRLARSSDTLQKNEVKGCKVRQRSLSKLVRRAEISQSDSNPPYGCKQITKTRICGGSVIPKVTHSTSPCPALLLQGLPQLVQPFQSFPWSKHLCGGRAPARGHPDPTGCEGSAQHPHEMPVGARAASGCLLPRAARPQQPLPSQTEHFQPPSVQNLSPHLCWATAFHVGCPEMPAVFTHLHLVPLRSVIPAQLRVLGSTEG